jgi:small subunit ribosomal protein S16
MALKIRLRRMGRKKAPTYRIVIAESSMPRDGRFVANVGHYNPRTEPVTLVVNKPEIRLWLARGAVPTETVGRLLKRVDLSKDDEPTVIESAVDAVKGTAKRVASAASAAVAAVSAAAESVTETVVEAAESAVETVREAVSGGEEPVVDASVQAAAADDAAAEVEADPTSAE